MSEELCSECGHLLTEHDEDGCNHEDKVEYTRGTFTGPMMIYAITGTKYCRCKHANKDGDK